MKHEETISEKYNNENNAPEYTQDPQGNVSDHTFS